MIKFNPLTGDQLWYSHNRKAFKINSVRSDSSQSQSKALGKGHYLSQCFVTKKQGRVRDNEVLCYSARTEWKVNRPSSSGRRTGEQSKCTFVYHFKAQVKFSAGEYWDSCGQAR